MHPVGERDQNRRSQDDQEEMCDYEVGTPQRHFHDFHNELSSRLGDGRVSEAPSVPFTCPPGTIGLIVLVFSGKENGDQNLVDRTLDGDDSNQTQDGVGGIPKLEEPLYRGSER